MSVLETILAVALSASAIASPIFVTYFNNKFQLELNNQANEQALKLKELEYDYNVRNVTISLFLENLCKYISNPSKENLLNYRISSSKAYMYLPKGARDAVDGINYDIDQGREISFANEFEDLLSALNKSITN